jgi:ATP-dependent Zn protease
VTYDNTRVAVHEAGHALMACSLSLPIAAVSLGTDGDDGEVRFSGGATLAVFDEFRVTGDPRINLLMSAAGIAAECVTYGSMPLDHIVGSFDDVSHIAAVVRSTVAPDKRARYVVAMMDEAVDILSARRQALDAIAAALLERGTLSGADVQQIVRAETSVIA